MHHFEYRNSALHVEDVALSILAEKFGTPLYVYSQSTLERPRHVFSKCFCATTGKCFFMR